MSEQKSLKPKYEKLVQSIVRVLSIAVIGSIVLDAADISEAAGDATLPLLGAELLMQACLLWNKHRKVSVISVICGTLILIYSLIALFVR